MALIHVITPRVGRGILNNTPMLLNLSILPTFISYLPLLVHILRISFVFPEQFTNGDLARMSSKLSYLSLRSLDNVVEKDGVANLCVTIGRENVTVTFTDDQGRGLIPERGAKKDVASHVNSLDSNCHRYTRTFPLQREKAIYVAVAFCSEDEKCYVPVFNDQLPSLPSLCDARVTIIQLLARTPPGVVPCSISCLPVELLSLIFSFVGTSSASNLPDVCQLWKIVSVPYWEEVISAAKGYARLKLNPGAGRLWGGLIFDESVSVEKVKEVIEGSPNVTEVRMDAFWDEEEAKILLNAIEGLKRVDAVTFRKKGLRKWRREEVENFMQRMGNRIKRLEAYDVEDSAAPASSGLPLPPGLESLDLDKYPPLASFSFLRTLRHLHLSHLCPLPHSIMDYPLPPLLDYLRIELAPFSADGKTSILPIPLDLSHLTQLTKLVLDGGEETSNMVPRRFFSTLRNATAIWCIRVKYCVVDALHFPDFIRWFFGDWRVRGTMRGDRVDGKAMGWYLDLVLFFGEWRDEQILNANRTIGECTEAKIAAQEAQIDAQEAQIKTQANQISKMEDQLNIALAQMKVTQDDTVPKVKKMFDWFKRKGDDQGH
ncbi:hypothetical protein BT69DRAFT_1356574 [Atractiella rhizophila]|nr:hypothetical protein BT69DRAFT_1356574 [Atractiella rhizophila]